jgi:preprotein translocase subunit SecA
MTSAAVPSTSSPASLAWPPPGLALAAHALAERNDTRDSGFDRWVAGGWLGRVPGLGARQRFLARLMRGVDAVAPELAAADDAHLRRQLLTIARPAFVDGHRLPEALAIVREAAQRTLGLKPHPSQLAAAAHLVAGRCVEFDTGEGKTLTAALAACIGACARVPTHVVTVNDYLAERDAQTLAPLFAFFGLTVGCVHSKVEQGARAAEYRHDITYCTNKDLVFDYLRDRVESRGQRSPAQRPLKLMHGERSGAPLRLRGLHFAIVDEADSILVDEARTPLILSAIQPAATPAETWLAILALARELVEDQDFKLGPSRRVPELTAAGAETLTRLAAEPRFDGRLEELRAVEWVREHYALQALRALHVIRRDHHYVVHEGKVVIVDEFTGRMLPDRSWEQGLHQLIEAIEGCEITGGNRTLARLTYQAYFARYLRLAGMSGTLREVAAELGGTYALRTVRVEPNRPSQRRSWPALLLPDEAAKLAAIVAEVQTSLSRGQAVLVGTRSVEASLRVADGLASAGIEHRVLNALQDAEEAALVASAGQPRAVTVATNMAGRGTDIVPAPEVIAAGGLHVILSEWHESARIDRQLFGRGARQGDPGSCRAIVALDDEIVQLHAAAPARWVAARWPGGIPAWAVQALRRFVQYRAERLNAATRRATMRHDRRMRDQLAFAGVAE